MFINTDLSTDNLALTFQQKRAEGSAQTAASMPAGSIASQLDSSLQRLTDIPDGVQSGDWEIADEQGAGLAVESARQSMLLQPGSVLAAQANQVSENVLNLLQPTD